MGMYVSMMGYWVLTGSGRLAVCEGNLLKIGRGGMYLNGTG